MAYDELLAQRLSEALDEQPNVEDKKMFGGVGYLVNGNMVCGVLNEDLIVRVGPEGYEEALGEEHVREFDITGRAMRGWVMVGPEGHASDDDLTRWVSLGLDFALSLPPK